MPVGRRPPSSTRENLSAAIHVDAACLARLVIAAPEATILLCRPDGTGLAWDVAARGRHRSHEPLGPRAPQGAMRVNQYLRHAAAWIDGCHAALPRRRQVAIALRGALDRARLSL